MKKSIGKICYNSLAKSLSGSKVLLISPTEESSKRIWYELQKVGKQATFFTVKTLFPTEKTIEEGYDLAIRTGITNIVTIGSANICDVGKGISTLYENNVKKVRDLKHVKKSIDQPNGNGIPILSIASTISPVHSTSSWMCLHKEDDILVNRSCKPVNEVVFDHEDIIKSPTFCKEAILGYLFAHLYDTIFSYSLDKSMSGVEDKKIKEDISMKIIDYFERIVFNNFSIKYDNTPTFYSKLKYETIHDDEVLTFYSNLANVLGLLRSDVFQSGLQIGAARWPGIIEKACFINMLRQNRVSRLPFSWEVTALLPTILESIKFNKEDDKISKVGRLSYEIFSEIVDFDKLSTIVKANSKLTKSKILQLQEYDKINYYIQKDKDSTITAAQLLETEIMNAEFKDENRKKDPLLEMLNSNIMLEVTEKAFKSTV